MAETLREKISRYIYKKGVNTSSRERTVPTDNDKISDKSIISVINFGSDLDAGTLYIRASFHGSKTFYSINIKIEDYELWAKRIFTLVNESTIDMDEEEEVEIDF